MKPSPLQDQAKPNPIELAMQRQQLLAENKRVHVFIILLLFLFGIVAALRMFPELVHPQLRSALLSTFLPVSIFLSGFLVYEVGVVIWLQNLKRRHEAVPRRFLFLNALIEISFPTATIAIGSHITGGLPMLAGALPYLYFLFISLTALSLDTRLCVYTGTVASIQFLLISLFLLRLETSAPTENSMLAIQLRSPHQLLIKSMLFFAGGCISAFVARQIRSQLSNVIKTMQERDRAISIFGQHVSPQVADLLLHQPTIASGEERQVCVMFLDIRDFSRIAAERSPTQVMEYLNALFGLMIPVINDHRGIINKFLGDGFMAVFGAPLDDVSGCQHAVDAGRRILQKVDEMNATQAIPPTRLGIGLHLGVALTGNVGGGERKEYTVIGDVVNVAARIEQATKQHQAQLLISEEVARSLPHLEAKDLGLVELKGQPKPLRLFQVV